MEGVCIIADLLKKRKISKVLFSSEAQCSDWDRRWHGEGGVHIWCQGPHRQDMGP